MTILSDCFDDRKAVASTIVYPAIPIDALNNGFMTAINYIQDWPANNPDINSVENIPMMYLEKKSGRETSSILKLKESLISMWKSCKMTCYIGLQTVPRKLQEVIYIKSNTTRY